MEGGGGGGVEGGIIFPRKEGLTLYVHSAFKSFKEYLHVILGMMLQSTHFLQVDSSTTTLWTNLFPIADCLSLVSFYCY